jgi:hypothetical protein
MVTAPNGGHTATATVVRRPLTSQTQVTATLGYAGSYNLVNQATGTFTSLPAVGKVVRDGQVLYRVTGSPVLLLYGRVPAYRDLAEGMTGADVAELNTDLVKLGYASAALLGPRSGWVLFSTETAYALEQLQTSRELTVTGTLPLGQAVFAPKAARITGTGPDTVLGGAAAPATVALTATSTTPAVTIDLDAAQQTEVKKGDKVSITLPDGAVTPGVVTSVGRVATSSSPTSGSSSSSGSGSSDSASGSGPTITVLVSLTNPKAAEGLDQAPVTVSITTGSVASALVIPVNALLSRPGGTYEVEVAGPHGHNRLVPVSVGIFDDAVGLVQVTSTGLSPGQRVVVPAP